MDVTMSAVVLALRVDAALLQTLHCLRCQTHEALEIVLVLPAAEDIADDGAGTRLVRCTCSQGVCHNSGLWAARGEIVAFLQSGVLPGPDWAVATVAAYEDHSVSAATGAVVSGQSNWMSAAAVVRDRSTGQMFVVDSPLDSYVVPGADPYLIAPGANLSVRRSPLLDVGGFDESSPRAVEEDLVRRLIDGGRRVVHAPGAVVHDLRERASGAASGPGADSLERCSPAVNYEQSREAFEPISAGLRSPGVVRCLIRYDGDRSNLPNSSTHDEWHVLFIGGSKRSVAPEIWAGQPVGWVHSVPAIGGAVTAVPTSAALDTVGREAGLLRELMQLSSRRGGVVVEDQRGFDSWPFSTLLAADEPSRHRMVSQLVMAALRSDAPCADAVAAELLDGDAYPVPLPWLVRSTLVDPDDAFLSEVFETLVRRLPTDSEITYYAALVARPGGRARTVRNLASSREGQQPAGQGGWKAMVDDDVEATRWDRLRAALDLPAERFLAELYSTVLRRPPDAEGLAHHLPWAASRAGRIELVRSIASSDEANAVGVDASLVLIGIGAPPRVRPSRIAMIRRILGGVRRQFRSVDASTP